MASRAWRLALCTAVGLAFGCGPAEPERPNLLLVSVDTLRADALDCYRPGAAGAGLCALFDGGTRYEWAFSTAACTAPAVASLLTSRYPAYHGLAQAIASYLREDVTTLAEALAGAGYATAAVVSNPVLHAGRNLGQGFQRYDATMTRREPNRPGFAEREAASTTDAALAWVESADEPWFLWVHYQDPHGPYWPPEAEGEVEVEGAADGDATWLPVLEDESGRGGIPAYQALPGLFTAEAYAARYRAEVAYLSRHVVRLVEGVDAAGPPPVLLLTADHGEAFGEDGYWFAHGHSLGLEQVRVPMLLRGTEAGREGELRSLAPPVGLVDVAPTLLALAGVDAPPGFQGRVLPGALGEEPPDEDVVTQGRALFAEHDRRGAIVAEGRFYSRNRDPDDAGAEPTRAPAGSLCGLDQELAGLPARAHVLEGSSGSEYRAPSSVDAGLERRLAAYLERTRERRGVRHERVSDEIRARMRALGYVVEEAPEGR